jgi:thiamine-phosphate pyrophosphorylase
LEAVDEALSGVPPGGAAVQLREKDLEALPLFRFAEALREVTARHRALFFVNERVDIARAVGADGVHLPGRSFRVKEVRGLFPAALVGVSTHRAAEVKLAAHEGADFAVLGPIFDTPSKRAYGPPVGTDALREAAAFELPVFAVGGITEARAAEVLQGGAFGVACIAAVLGTEQPRAAAAALWSQIVDAPHHPLR